MRGRFRQFSPSADQDVCILPVAVDERRVFVDGRRQNADCGEVDRRQTDAEERERQQHETDADSRAFVELKRYRQHRAGDGRQTLTQRITTITQSVIY